MRYSLEPDSILPTLSLDNNVIANKYHQHDEFALTIIEEILHCMKSAYITPLIQEAEDIIISYHHKEYDYPVDIIILLCQGDVSLVYNYILLKQAKNAEIPISLHVVIDLIKLPINNTVAIEAIR